MKNFNKKTNLKFLVQIVESGAENAGKTKKVELHDDNQKYFVIGENAEKHRDNSGWEKLEIVSYFVSVLRDPGNRASENCTNVVCINTDPEKATM
jgi:hypothetical protein